MKNTLLNVLQQHNNINGSILLQNDQLFFSTIPNNATIPLAPQPTIPTRPKPTDPPDPTVLARTPYASAGIDKSRILVQELVILVHELINHLY